MKCDFNEICLLGLFGTVQSDSYALMLQAHTVFFRVESLLSTYQTTQCHKIKEHNMKMWFHISIYFNHFSTRYFVFCGKPIVYSKH